MAEEINSPGTVIATTAGSAGLSTQQGGQATTVDGIAAASGGIGAGQLMEADVDQDLFEFEGDDAPLMQLMMAAKKRSVNSPIVQHYMLDEERTSFTTNAALSATTSKQAVLPLDAEDQQLCQPYGTLRVRGVNGYSEDGSKELAGIDLELFVVGRDATTSNPIVMAVNGSKTNTTDAYCTIPAIPEGATIDILGNALHETQREVAPDSSQPVPTEVYLQKRGMNRVVSDYFDSQRKRIPFTNALLAERDIRKFKRAGNRTLWIGKKGKISVEDPKVGYQDVYFTEGVRWQFKREVQHSGKWTYEEFIALAKMFYTGADVPENAICLCGKNFLENIQCIDFSKHPEVQMEVKTITLSLQGKKGSNSTIGWEITCIHTVFGDLCFKREPTLDKLGYSNSAGIFGENRLVHYQRTAEHSETERIDGHEAKRESVIVWDALALKGACHLFVNGEGTEAAANAVSYVLYTDSTAPENPVSGTVYYFTADCTLDDNNSAKSGQTWLYDETAGWSLYNGEITV